jgi:hypothetical protein
MNSNLLCFMIPMLIAGCQGHPESTTPPAPPIPAPAPAQTTANVANESLLEGMFKSLDDLEQGLDGVDKLEINLAAERIAQVDEWLYPPDTEVKARERINIEVNKLRGRIETNVRKLLTEAIKAKNGKAASERMAKVNSLLVLYPAPSNEAQHKKLEQLSASVLSASRRVEDIRRLRYNEWAIDYINGSLKAYRGHMKVKRPSDVFGPDRDALIRSSISWLGPIDPSFLEPAVMDLYNYVYGLTRDAMGNDDERRIKLTQGFANPNQQRKTPVDF